jgi:glycosyltransferase involved in cell wall biosynthesis
MRVLIDYHHHDLYESMELLCARLGWTLYRPIGMDWFDQEYWNFERTWHGDAVARQYLQPWHDDEPGRRWDAGHERWQNTLTLAEARTVRPDIVIASVAHNHEGLHRFAKEVGATFGIHLGNVRFSPIDMAEDRWDLAEFGIVTTMLPAPVDKPHVTVHQEFSLADFRYEPATPGDRLRVNSFVNCFAENERGYAQFVETAAMLPEHDWGVYGSYGSKPEDSFARGNLHRCADVASAMRASDIAWHTKQWSDGFGFVIHNWFAVGRPVLGYEWYYRSQLAGPLWQEGVTSFDLTDKTPHEVGNLLSELQREPERIVTMGAAAAARFREVVDYDEEEQAIRAMFAAVLP